MLNLTVARARDSGGDSGGKPDVRVAFYCRVSTDGQTVENQRRELVEIAAARGWRVVGEFMDRGISGAKDRKGRPGYDQLIQSIERGEIDVVAAWSVDRLGRSFPELIRFFGDVSQRKVALYLHKQGLDTTTTAGRAMFGMYAVFAEFERAVVAERVSAGISRARAQGKHIGRPCNRTQDAEIRAQLGAGVGLYEIMRRLDVSERRIRRVMGEVAAEAAVRMPSTKGPSAAKVPWPTPLAVAKTA